MDVLFSSSPHAIDLILENLDFKSVKRLRQVNHILQRYINYHPPDIKLKKIHCELGVKKITIILSRDSRHNREGDPFDAEIKYTQEGGHVWVQNNGRRRTLHPMKNLYDVAIKDLQFILRSQRSLLLDFVIFCENFRAEDYRRRLRVFHERLRSGLEHRLRPMSVHMLHMSIPSDESLLMHVFPHLDLHDIASLQIDNCDPNAPEDTVLRLNRIVNTLQWEQLDYVCINQGFQVRANIAQFIHIPVRRVQYHPRSIARFRQNLRRQVEAMQRAPE